MDLSPKTPLTRVPEHYARTEELDSAKYRRRKANMNLIVAYKIDIRTML